MESKPGLEGFVTQKSSPPESFVTPPPSQFKGDESRDAYVGGVAVELYEPIPEYEGRHRYDPTAEWTEKEEKKLVRRV